MSFECDTLRVKFELVKLMNEFYCYEFFNPIHPKIQTVAGSNGYLAVACQVFGAAKLAFDLLVIHICVLNSHGLNGHPRRLPWDLRIWVE